MRRTLCLLLIASSLALIAFGCSPSRAPQITRGQPPLAPAVVEVGDDGLITLGNGVIRMVVDPNHGGSVVSFIHKSGADAIPPDRGKDKMGLFLDHYYKAGWQWPGEMMEAAYKVEEIKSGPRVASVRMTYTLRGRWMNWHDPKVEGLVFEKVLTLRAGVDAVWCRVSFTNPTQEPKLFTYWQQQYSWVGGDYDPETDVYSRPSARGVRRRPKLSDPAHDFIGDIFAGWSAATDTVKGRGLVWVMDYNSLNRLYDVGGNVTKEWLHIPSPVPPGKTWETDIVLFPTEDLGNIAHASRHFVAGLEVQRSGTRIVVIHHLRAGVMPVTDLELETYLYGVSDGVQSRAVTVKAGQLNTATRTVTQEFSNVPPDPLAVHVTARGRAGGKTFEKRYWDFHVGSYGYGDNIQMDMATPLYAVRPPKKILTILRPEKIERTRDKGLYCVMQGMNHEPFRLGEILKLAGAQAAPEGVPATAHYSCSAYGEGARLSVFPSDYETLMRYDALIAANVSITSTGVVGMEMAYDYLTHGGGLLVLGGKAAYGAGGWRESRLAELLPVEVDRSKFDIEKIDDGNLALAEAHRITDGLSVKDKPRVEFLHRARVKKGAEVLLTAGGKPFLVVWEYKGARIACVLGAPYGEDEAGAGPLFFSWDDWPKLMANTLLWLGRRDKPRPNPGSGGR